MIRRMEEEMIRSLIIMMIVLQALFCSKVKLKVVLIFRLYKVIKLVLWTCGDIEKNPGPTSPGLAKIEAMRELTPILLKIIFKIPTYKKAPKRFYTDKKYKPPGFEQEVLDPNNNKILVKKIQLETSFWALVRYCGKKAITIPDMYRDEIEALKSNDFASLEKCRLIRHFKDQLDKSVQNVVNCEREAIEDALKIVEETEILLRGKLCDVTATEKQISKRKHDSESDGRGYTKRQRTDSQKQNEPVESTSNCNQNPSTSVADSGCTDSTLDYENGMCNSDKSPHTPENLDAFCANDQNENQNESDDLKMVPNNDISEEKHRITVSAHEKNQPKANDIPCQKHDIFSTNTLSTSEQGTHDDQNATFNSDESLLSKDEFQTLVSWNTEDTGLNFDDWMKQIN